MLNKITTIGGSVYLFIDIPHEIRNRNNIASGESVLLTIYENDKFYFSSDINLVNYDSIISKEKPTDKEKEFFEYVKEEKEVKLNKALLNEYGIAQYIRYLPKITYKQEKVDNNYLIKATIRYTESIHPLEIPRILIDDKEIPLINNNEFEYLVEDGQPGQILSFTMDLPKQEFTRSYTIK